MLSAPSFEAQAETDGTRIRVRNPKFAVAEVPRHWLMKSRIATQIANGANLIFPAGERYFIRSVKHFLDQVEDPTLREDVRAFFGQEGRHAHAHEDYFKTLRTQGFDVDSFLRVYELFAFEFLERILPPKIRLAGTAACEHFTAILAEGAILEGALGEAHPAMRALLTWHALEEIEHRAVAFDVLRAVDDSYALRMMGLALSATMLSTFWTCGTLWMLAQDEPSLASFRREIKHGPKRRGVLARVFARGIREYVKRDFHPATRDMSAIVARAQGQLEQLEQLERTKQTEPLSAMGFLDPLGKVA